MMQGLRAMLVDRVAAQGPGCCRVEIPIARDELATILLFRGSTGPDNSGSMGWLVMREGRQMRRFVGNGEPAVHFGSRVNRAKFQ